MSADNPYRVRLSDLGPRPATHDRTNDRLAGRTGEDARDEGGDPGTSTAYVAETIKNPGSQLTIEGMINGIGNAAGSAAARKADAPMNMMRFVAALFVVPLVLIVVVVIANLVHHLL